MNPQNIVPEQTCLSYPEQYDIYYEGEYIGWIKLRYGILRAMDVHNVEIYRHDFHEEYKGYFDTPVERFNWLTKF